MGLGASARSSGAGVGEVRAGGGVEGEASAGGVEGWTSERAGTGGVLTGADGATTAGRFASAGLGASTGAGGGAGFGESFSCCLGRVTKSASIRFAMSLNTSPPYGASTCTSTVAISVGTSPNSGSCASSPVTRFNSCWRLSSLALAILTANGAAPWATI
jgi:hypothetical protein